MDIKLLFQKRLDLLDSSNCSRPLELVVNNKKCKFIRLIIAILEQIPNDETDSTDKTSRTAFSEKASGPTLFLVDEPREAPVEYCHVRNDKNLFLKKSVINLFDAVWKDDSNADITKMLKNADGNGYGLTIRKTSEKRKPKISTLAHRLLRWSAYQGRTAT